MSPGGNCRHNRAARMNPGGGFRRLHHQTSSNWEQVEGNFKKQKVLGATKGRHSRIDAEIYIFLSR